MRNILTNNFVALELFARCNLTGRTCQSTLVRLKLAIINCACLKKRRWHWQRPSQRYCTAESAAAEAVVCLTSPKGTGKGKITPRKYTYEDGYDVCIRYQTLTGSLWTWAYGATSSAECAQMMHQNQLFKNVHCCMQRNCNTPDPVLDPSTPVAFPAHRRTRSSSAATDQKLHARTRRLHQQISRQHLPPANGSKEALTCYKNVHRKGFKSGRVPAVAARTYKRTGVGEVCVRYSYKCADGDLACSSQDIAAGAWKWMYAPLAASTCLELQSYSNRADALVKHVRCCTGPLCNRPGGKSAAVVQNSRVLL